MILDIMMPGIDGFEVCRILRNQEETANLPIIMLSARADAESVNRGLLLGATKYLTKPVMPDELTRHVREVLNVSDGIA
jgi:DNA-binding response OmpR family regulator